MGLSKWYNLGIVKDNYFYLLVITPTRAEIEKISAGMEIITDINEGNAKNSTIDVGTAIVDKYIGDKIKIPNKNLNTGTFIRNVINEKAASKGTEIIKDKLKEDTSDKKVESEKTTIRSKF